MESKVIDETEEFELPTLDEIFDSEEYQALNDDAKVRCLNRYLPDLRKKLHELYPDSQEAEELWRKSSKNAWDTFDPSVWDHIKGGLSSAGESLAGSFLAPFATAIDITKAYAYDMPFTDKTQDQIAKDRPHMSAVQSKFVNYKNTANRFIGGLVNGNTNADAEKSVESFIDDMEGILKDDTISTKEKREKIAEAESSVLSTGFRLNMEQKGNYDGRSILRDINNPTLGLINAYMGSRNPAYLTEIKNHYLLSEEERQNNRREEYIIKHLNDTDQWFDKWNRDYADPLETLASSVSLGAGGAGFKAVKAGLQGGAKGLAKGVAKASAELLKASAVEGATEFIQTYSEAPYDPKAQKQATIEGGIAGGVMAGLGSGVSAVKNRFNAKNSAQENAQSIDEVIDSHKKLGDNEGEAGNQGDRLEGLGLETQEQEAIRMNTFAEAKGNMNNIVDSLVGDKVSDNLPPAYSSAFESHPDLLKQEFLGRLADNVIAKKNLGIEGQAVWEEISKSLKNTFRNKDISDIEIAEFIQSSVTRTSLESAENISAQKAVPATEKTQSNTWQAFTPDNENHQVSGSYDILESSDLLSSSDEGFNPALQPRDRQRSASQIQISEIASNLNPNKLLESQTTDTGAPIINTERNVLSGNGRVSALRQAYSQNTKESRSYRDMVINKAIALGMSPEKAHQLKNPILVRKVDNFGNLSQEEFVQRSNKSAVLKMSELEQAQLDAQNILTPQLIQSLVIDDTKGFLSADNASFMSQFIEQTGDWADLTNKKGEANINSVKRVKSALLASVLGNNPTTINTIFEAPENFKNLADALTNSAPKIIALKNSAYDISQELAQAIDGYIEAQKQGWSVDKFIAQTDFLQSPLSQEAQYLIKAIDNAKRSPKQIEKIFSDYFENSSKIDTQTQGLFGNDLPSKLDVLANNYGDNVNYDTHYDQGETKATKKGKCSSIDELLNSDLKGSNSLFYDFGELDADAVNVIKEETGIDLTGYIHTATSNALSHVNKKHGDPKTEESRGQVAIRKSDWRKVHDFVNFFDSVSFNEGHQSRDSNVKSLEFQKDGYVYIAEVRAGRKKLASVSLWKHKKDSRLSKPIMDKTSPSHTSETPPKSTLSLDTQSNKNPKSQEKSSKNSNKDDVFDSGEVSSKAKADRWAESYENLESAVDKYIETTGLDKKTGQYLIDPDEIRKLVPNYDISNNADFLQAGDKILELAWANALESAPKDKDVVLLTGNPAAGKGSSMEKGLLNEVKNAGLVFDAPQNKFSSVEKRVEQAVNAGHTVTIVQIYNDPVTSWENALKRGIAKGRFLPLDYFVNGAYMKSIGKVSDIETILKPKYGRKINTIYIDNTGNNPRKVSSEEAILWDYSLNEKQLEEIERITYERINEINESSSLRGDKQNPLAIISQGLSSSRGDIEAEQNTLSRIASELQNRISQSKRRSPNGNAEEVRTGRLRVEDKSTSNERIKHGKNWALPEIVNLAKNLMGKYPLVVEFPNPNTRGAFHPKKQRILLARNTAEILTPEELADIKQQAFNSLRLIKSLSIPNGYTPEAFQRLVHRDSSLRKELAHQEKILAEDLRRKVGAYRESVASNVVAHELGHYVDFFVDNGLAHGNILGHLAGLKGYMQKSIKDSQGNTHYNETIRQELIDLSLYWRRDDASFDSLSAKDQAYISSPSELYADAFSVLLNDIASFERIAPNAFNAFRNFMDTRPKALKLYQEMVEVIQSGKDAVVKKRRARVQEMLSPENQEKGKAKEDKKWSDKYDFWMYRLKDTYAPIYKRVRRNAKDLDANYYDWIMDKLSSYNLRAGHHELYYTRLENKVYKPLKKLNIDRISFDEFLLYRHIIENRAGIFNTLAIDAKAATENLADMQEVLGKDAMDTMLDASNKWWKLRKKMVIDPLKKADIFDDNLMAIIEHRPDYVPFRKLNKGEEYDSRGEEMLAEEYKIKNDRVRAVIHEQIGFLGEIVSPMDSLAGKDLALMDYIARNDASKAIVDVLQKTDPEICVEAVIEQNEVKYIRNKHVGTMVFFEKGKPKAYYVPIDVAQSLNGSVELASAVKFYSAMGNFLKRLFTSLNPNFLLTGGTKDIWASYRRLPSAGLKDIRNIPVIGQFAWFARNILSIHKGIDMNYGHTRLVKGTRKVLNSLGLPVSKESGNYDHLLENRAVMPDRRSLGAGGAMWEGSISESLASFKKEKGLPLTDEGKAKFSKKALGLIRFLLGSRGLLNPFAYVEGAAKVMERTGKITAYDYLKKHSNLSEEAILNAVRNHGSSPNFAAHGSWSRAIDCFTLFYNAGVQGLGTELDAARHDKFYYWRTAQVVAAQLFFNLGPLGILGGAVMSFFASLAGADDEDELIEMASSMSNYHRTNNLCILTGWDNKAQHKAGYGVLPLDELPRIIGGTIQKLVLGDSAGDTFSFLKDQLIAGNPLAETLSKWGDYLMGENPRDSFRGRNVLSQNTYNMGGVTAFIAMLKDTSNSLGGSVVYRFKDDYLGEGDPTATEEFFDIPVIGSLANRFYKVSNQGFSDNVRKYGEDYSKSIANNKVTQEKYAIRLLEGEELSEADYKDLHSSFTSKAEIISFKNKIVQAQKSKALYFYRPVSNLPSKNHKRAALQNLLENKQISQTDFNNAWAIFNLNSP